MWAKQSTAITMTVGPILDSAGAEYTSAVIGDLSIRKHDGSVAALAAAATLTHVANGHYTLVTTTGNTDTLGRLQIHCNKSTYQMPPYGLVVLPPTVYDALMTTVNTTGGLAAATGTISQFNGSISTYSGIDTDGTTTLLTRLTSGRAGNLDNLDASISSVITAIGNLNNLSALINVYGSPLLEIPDSGTTPFAFTVVVRDNEGKLVALDGSPTIAAANAAGTDRSANLSAVSNPATGRYTFTYTVEDDAVEESLRITVTGAVSAEARYIEWIGAVVNYDTLTQINAIKAKTDQLTFTETGIVDARLADGIAHGGDDTTLKLHSDGGALPLEIHGEMTAAAEFHSDISAGLALAGGPALELTGAFLSTHADNDIRGVQLAPDGLDEIPLATPPWPPTNLIEALTWVYRWFFKKKRRDRQNNLVELFNDAGNTVVVQQATTDSVTEEIIDAAEAP